MIIYLYYSSCFSLRQGLIEYQTCVQHCMVRIRRKQISDSRGIQLLLLIVPLLLFRTSHRSSTVQFIVLIDVGLQSIHFT